MLLVLGLFFLHASRLLAATTSIKFDVSGFQVTRVWTAASLGIPVSSDPTCMSTTCTRLGGIVFSADGNTLYAVAAADTSTSALYAVSVVRSATTSEVTGLLGPATKVFDGNPPPVGGGGLDAGLEFGPLGTLFYSYVQMADVLGERVGTTERQFDLGVAPANVPNSMGGFTFSPFRIDPGTGFGVLQLNPLNLPDVYELSLAPAGGGFFTPSAPGKTLFVTLPDSNLANLQYVPSAPFAGDLMYEEYNAGQIHYIAIDQPTGLAIDSVTGQPTLGTAHPIDTTFAHGFGSNNDAGPFGLEFDPRNNDLFVSTADGDASIFNSIIQIQGFSHVTTTTTTMTSTTQSTTTSTSTSSSTSSTSMPASTTTSSSVPTSTSTSSSTSTTQSTTMSTSSSTSTIPSTTTSTSTSTTGSSSSTSTTESSTTSTSNSTTSTTSTSTPSTTTTTMAVCILDVDGNGTGDVSTDVVYINRRLLLLTPVPPSYRLIDPTIPPDETIAANVDAIGSSLDVDMNGQVEASTDIVYIRRRLLQLTPVPPSFRILDPTIPSDDAIAQRVDALCPP